MEELVELMTEIRDLLKEIRGDGLFNSISDLYKKMDEISGTGPYDSITDICDKIEELDSKPGSIEHEVSMIHLGM